MLQVRLCSKTCPMLGCLWRGYLISPMYKSLYSSLHCIYTCLVVGVLDVHLLSEILKILFSDTPAIHGMTISLHGEECIKTQQIKYRAALLSCEIQ